MKQKLFSIVFIVALIFSVSAQTAKQAKPKPDLTLERLRGAVTYLASDALEGRRTGTKGAIVAAGYIAGEFAKIGLQPGVKIVSSNVNPSKAPKISRGFLQEFKTTLPADKEKLVAEQNQITAYNVVGILPGNDATLKTEAIIIGAHFDHLGRGGKDSLAAGSTEIHYGADDNASGVAGLLELARIFKAEKKNRRTIIFIAFGAEEEGLVGSRFYVNNPVFPLDKTLAMINMDMIGRLKENKLSVGGAGTASEWKSLIETKNNEQKNDVLVPTNLPNGRNIEGFVGKPAVALSNVPFSLQLNEDGFGPSDHSSFYGKQIPVLFFFTGAHADYHKPSDTPEKINYDGLKQIVSFVAEIVKSIDASDKRPTYVVVKSAGAMQGRTTFNVSLGTIPGYGEATNDGLLLDGVRPESPAEKAGLKAGDKIVKLAGKEIRNIRDYTAILGELEAGKEYEIEIVRGSEKLTLKITPAARK